MPSQGYCHQVMDFLILRGGAGLAATNGGSCRRVQHLRQLMNFATTGEQLRTPLSRRHRHNWSIQFETLQYDALRAHFKCNLWDYTKGKHTPMGLGCFRTSRLVCSSADDHSQHAKLVKVMLDREWLLPLPTTTISRVHIPVRDNPPEISRGVGDSSKESELLVIRDDLLHPLLGGNKIRKLDALLPDLLSQGATHIVTCGGCQSAHTAAVAVACAERGVRAHLLLRGEAPAVATGYNLISSMFGSVTYVPRSVYSDRDGMLRSHASRVAEEHRGRVLSEQSPDPNRHRRAAGSVDLTADASCQSEENRRVEGVQGGAVVGVIREGAGDVSAMLGLVRLVAYLATTEELGGGHEVTLVIDAGTGTTAVGMAIGVALLRLPWTVVGIMLADTQEAYLSQQQRLTHEFLQAHVGTSPSDPPSPEFPEQADQQPTLELPLLWVERRHPRKFGRVLDGEIDACKRVASQTGILLDPIYTLSAWETAVALLRSDTWFDIPPDLDPQSQLTGTPHPLGELTAEREEEGSGTGESSVTKSNETRTYNARGGQTSIMHELEVKGGERRGCVLGCTSEDSGGEGTEKKSRGLVAMLHTGGTLGLFGLAQRYPDQFRPSQK